jgi:long-subunit fatty acid transport protein
MMKKLLILTTVLFYVSSLKAELDWNITGSGARAAGMGNAFIGLADDATAINWNPGGLTALEHFEASVVGGVVHDKEEYTYSDNEDYENSSNFKYTHANLNFLSVAYPLRIKEKKLVLAAAFQKQLDFFSEDESENETNRYTYNYESEGGVYTVNLGASYQILPYLSIGATGNIWTGGSESTQEQVWDTYSETFNSENNNFSGFNLTAGALFDMSAIKDNVPLKIGAVIKTPFDLDYDYEESFESSDGYTYEGSLTGSVEMPVMFGMGASYRIGENFTLAADIEYRNYAKSKFLWKDDESGETGEAFMSPSEKDVTQFRLGMEYLIITDAVVVPLRLGIFNYPTLWADKEDDLYYQGDDGYGNPIYEADTDVSDLEQLVGFGMSIGSGLVFESFSVDLCMNVFSYENTYSYRYMDGPWSGYEYEESWTTTKANAAVSAVIYLDTFIK